MSKASRKERAIVKQREQEVKSVPAASTQPQKPRAFTLNEFHPKWDVPLLDLQRAIHQNEMDEFNYSTVCCADVSYEFRKRKLPNVNSMQIKSIVQRLGQQQLNHAIHEALLVGFLASKGLQKEFDEFQIDMLSYLYSQAPNDLELVQKAVCRLGLVQDNAYLMPLPLRSLPASNRNLRPDPINPVI